MKDIIAGNKFYLKVADIIPCVVPSYPECKPCNVIDELDLRENQKFMQLFPELSF